MNMQEALEAVAAGTLSVEDALANLNQPGLESLGHATVDHDRARRCIAGVAEYDW